jgi:hypothetical protein
MPVIRAAIPPQYHPDLQAALSSTGTSSSNHRKPVTLFTSVQARLKPA